MKRLIMAVFIITIGAGLYAQNIFFAVKKGMILTYANNDAKGNAQSYSLLTIKDVKGSGANMTITYDGASLDKSRKPVKGSEGTYKVEIKNNVVIMDMNQLVPPELKQQGVKIEVSGTPLELPGSLKPGQTLKNAVLNATMDLGVVKATSVTKMTDGKCLEIADVKVPAGTFKCHKITQKFTSTSMNITNVQTVLSWYAPNIGTVKTETYDDKNKLVSGTVLVELKGN